MNVTLAIEKTYTITIAGREHRGCRLISTWEGFGKFRTPKGEVIILDGVQPTTFTDLFADLLGAGESSRDCILVKATPDLYAGG